jgi:hypothetical protein
MIQKIILITPVILTLAVGIAVELLFLAAWVADKYERKKW